MPYQKKTPEIIYRGSSKWLQVPDDYEPAPNENVIETDNIARKVQRSGFEITYLMYFFDLFEKLGGKKYVVVKYILEHKDTNNVLLATNRELADKCKVSLQTVSDTIKILREANLIQTRTGAIMLNPKLAHHGNIGKEKYLLQKFEAFDAFDE